MKSLNLELIKALPKIDLHCHIDGSVSPKTIAKIAQSGDVNFFAENMRAPNPCGSLTEYLRPFPFVLGYLQTADALRIAAYDVLEQAHNENIIYTELRFAPSLHMQKGLNIAEIIAAVLAGMDKAKNSFGISSGLILCLMRGASTETNMQIIKAAQQTIGKGIVCIDLAGDELSYPPEQYAALFAQAQGWGIPAVIHAGENGPPQNIKTAVEMGAVRIGHGIALKTDAALRRFCREKNIILEICPTSNLQTGAADSMADYPFPLFLREGIPVCVSTDNRTVSQTTLSNEFFLLSKAFPQFNIDVMKNITLAAAEFSFLSKNEKKMMLQKISTGFSYN